MILKNGESGCSAYAAIQQCFSCTSSIEPGTWSTLLPRRCLRRCRSLMLCPLHTIPQCFEALGGIARGEVNILTVPLNSCMRPCSPTTHCFLCISKMCTVWRSVFSAGCWEAPFLSWGTAAVWHCGWDCWIPFRAALGSGFRLNRCARMVAFLLSVAVVAFEICSSAHGLAPLGVLESGLRVGRRPLWLDLSNGSYVPARYNNFGNCGLSIIPFCVVGWRQSFTEMI